MSTQKRRSGYYCRLKIPDELRHTVGKRELVRSLGTRRASVARARGALLEAYWRQGLDALGRVDGLTEDRTGRLRALVREYFERKLEDIELAPKRSLEEAEGLELALYDQVEGLETSQAENSYDSVEALAANLLAAANVELDADGPDYRRFCRELLGAERELALRELNQATGRSDCLDRWWRPPSGAAGRDDDGSAKTTDSRPVSEIMSDFLSLKAAEGAWSESTARDVNKIYSAFIEVVGDRPIGEISKSQVREYWELLLRLPARLTTDQANLSLRELASQQHSKTQSPSTASKKAGFVRSLFLWALEQDLIEKDPSQGLGNIKRRNRQNERDSFTDSDLLLIFGEGYEEAARGWPDRYWIPLILAYTGARCGEIAQLHKEDIREIDDVWCIDINENSLGKTLKTDASARFVPIHSELLKRGFLRYVEQAAPGHLWPRLNKGANGYGDAIGKWFNRRLRDDLGFPRQKKVLHSLRHTFATKLKGEGVESYLISELLGHAHDGMTMGRYAKRLEAPKLKEVVERLRLPI